MLSKAIIFITDQPYFLIKFKLTFQADTSTFNH
ncbi:MAG: hypothetical protein JWR23_2100 [Mucilaginibacter sp.]|nr:hypothetical protein [Mucilaginibacter sp.]